MIWKDYLIDSFSLVISDMFKPYDSRISSKKIWLRDYQVQMYASKNWV